MSPADRALSTLAALAPHERLAAAARRLGGQPEGVLAGFAVASELAPRAGHLDGTLLEAIAAGALAGERGAVFTRPVEARLLAALGLARAASRRGVAERRALATLLGVEPATPEVAGALDGLRVLDPCCGAGALLVAALALSRPCGAELVLRGVDLSPLAADAARTRLALLGARAEVACADALEAPWPAADLVLSNPPFLRHEALPREAKRQAAARSGLSRQADLSAHLALLAIRHASEVALVWPRALDVSRSAAPLLAEARARGGFSHRLRSRVAGSFAASVDTLLAVWSEGHPGRPRAEASAPLGELRPEEVVGLVEGVGAARLRLVAEPGPAPRAAVAVRQVCEVRFGMKSGCNGFFHLKPLGADRFESALCGEVALSGRDAPPILASLKEASAPEATAPARRLFRPERLDRLARAYVAQGEGLGVARRPTCAGRSPWWLVAPGRVPAPVLYPAKVGARAFGVLNTAALWEDKKWHALFPRDGIEAWALALVLGATPVRLAIDVAARQLTGMQAIADVDCRVLAAAPFPEPAALAPLRADLLACRAGLARDPVTTDLPAMLDRPAQLALDALVARALGLGRGEPERSRRLLRERVAARLEHAAHVRAAVAQRGG